MRNFDEWCDFFKDIEADPTAITPLLTVRDLQEAKAHATECRDCSAIIDRVLASEPPKTFRDSVHLN